MNQETILVADDDREIVKAIRKLLEMEGYRVLSAYNGLEALEALVENEVHLIILDIMMPKLDGLSALMKIRENKNIPILLLSAKTEDICSRLAHLQYADGSFSWFNGMKGSLGMTLRVAEWLARAGALENGNATCGQVDLEKMMRYIAGHVQGAVKREREQEYKDNGAAWLSCMYILG